MIVHQSVDVGETHSQDTVNHRICFVNKFHCLSFVLHWGTGEDDVTEDSLQILRPCSSFSLRDLFVLENIICKQGRNEVRWRPEQQRRSQEICSGGGQSLTLSDFKL